MRRMKTDSIRDHPSSSVSSVFSLFTPHSRLLGPSLALSVSAPRLRVVAAGLEVNADERLVADDPGVVARRYRDQVAAPDLRLRAVVHPERHLPGDDVDEVRDFATLGAGDRLDGLRPLPARLESRAHHLLALQVQNLHL